MTFLQRHILTAPAATDVPASVNTVAGLSLAAGMYDHGLIALVDDRSARTLLSRWEWLKRPLVVLAATGFGDVFAWDESANEIYFLNVQHATLEFVDDEVEWFLDEFLENDGIVEKVLKRAQFERLQRRLRPLSYHDAFLLQPWLMLGGADRDENYMIGACSVYLDLVGQTHTLAT